MNEMNGRNKLDGGSISDQFDMIRRTTQALAVLRDGIREADGDGELDTWQNIADMLLEREVLELDSALREISEKLEGLEYEPVRMSPYSLLRASSCDCHKRARA